MTSQKSSLSTFSFTFFSALKGNFILPLINMIALTILVPVTSAITVRGFTGSTYDPRTGAMLESSAKITDLYKFLIFSEFGQISSNIGIHLAVIAFSILLGVVMFRFIASKKTVNVFYSLGITRKNLFVSKYLAGILMLAVSIVIPFLTCLLVNIATFGSSKELWSAIIYHILGYYALSLTAFSLTAAVFSCVGTIVEGIAFSGIIMLGPTMLFYGIQFLMKKLTLGSPYGHFYDLNYQVTNALATSLSRFNPILFLFKNVSKIGMLTRVDTDSEFVWNAPNFGDIVIWFIASAFLFALGIYLFQKRKAEICGFLGVNKWLNFGITFLVGFFPLTIAVSNSNSVLIGILIGIAIYIFLYLIIDFALIRNFKEWAKALYKLPIHLGISLIIVLIFASGLFGYSSRIPKIEKIESIEIAPVTYTGIIDPINSNSYGDGDFLYSVAIGKPISGFKSAKDLKTITGLHQLIIEAGKPGISPKDMDLPIEEQVSGTAIRISYHLNNGNTLNRFYDSAKKGTLTALLAIDETDRYKDLIIQNLTEPVTAADSSDVAANKNVFQGESSKVSIVSKNMDILKQLVFTQKKRYELLSALAKDLTSQTVKERFFPNSPAIGTIQFSPNNNPTYDYGYKTDSDIGGMTQLSGYGSASITITNDMVNTIKFCETNDYLKYFNNSAEPVSVQVISAKENITNYSYYGSEFSLHFMGGWTKILYEYGSFIGSYKTTNKAVVDEIAKNAYSSYFNSVDGYFVRFELEGNGGSSTKFVPSDKMPKNIINAVSQHIIKTDQNNPEKYLP